MQTVIFTELKDLGPGLFESSSNEFNINVVYVFKRL